MADEQDDRRILSKGTADLSEYLSSPVLFWRLQSESQPLTIGNLLLLQKKIAALHPDILPADVKASFIEVDKARAERPAAWQEKVNAELHSRFAQYQTLVDELDQGGFGVIARLRAILELILPEVSDPNNAGRLLEGFDKNLRQWLQPGEFIWPEVYQSSFPREKFWFLYGKPLKKVVK